MGNPVSAAFGKAERAARWMPIIRQSLEVGSWPVAVMTADPQGWWVEVSVYEKHIASLRAKLDEAERRIKELEGAPMASERAYNIAIQALAKIADPIGYLRRSAEEEGGRLNGQMAVSIADDPNWLRGIAKYALKEIGL